MLWNAKFVGVLLKLQMSNIESIVESLELKIAQILKHLDVLKAENRLLKTELDERQKQTKVYLDSLNQKEGELEALKVASSMLGSSEDKRASKLKINALIRDINDCIASLSD